MNICMRYVSQTGQRATPTARITCVARHLYPTRPRFRVHSTVAPRECGIGQFVKIQHGHPSKSQIITCSIIKLDSCAIPSFRTNLTSGIHFWHYLCDPRSKSRSNVTFMFITYVSMRFSMVLHMTYFEMLHKLLI